MKDLADRENDAVLWYGLSAAGIALKVTRRGHKLRRENKQNETALAAVEQQAANTWNSASAVIGKLRYETAAYREREGVFVNGILAQAGAINVSPDVLQQVINNAGHHAYRVVPPVVWQQYPAEAAPAQAPAPQPQPQQPMAQPAPAPLRRPEVVPQLVAEPEQPPPVTPAVVEPEPTREPVREPEATRIAPEPVVEPVVEQPPVVANQTETETPQPEPPRSELPRPAPVPAAAPQSNASRWLRRSQSNDDAPPPRERRPDRDDEQA